MKRVKVNFNFKSMALVLFALVLSSNVWGEWTKVTSAPTDWSGEYLLVYESSTTAGVAWTGDDATSCNVAVTISSGSIATKPDNAVSLTIASMTGGYSIKVNGGTNNGKYIKGTSNSNALGFDNNAQLNTLSYDDTNKGVLITSNTSVMRYNNTSDNYRFRYFKSSTYTKQQIVQLYKSAPSCTTYPSVSDGAISDATTSSLTFNCAGITSLGSAGCEITEYGYVYGTSKTPTTSDTKHKVGESYTTPGTAFAADTATGLNCGTTYYMRPYAINGNGPAYGAQVSLATLDCPVDHFIDNVQETDGYTGDGKAVSTSFAKASITLPDKATAISGSCEDIHYHFVGWVTAADRSEGNVDAEHIVNFQNSGNVPTGTTYYAVWAKEDE